MNEKTPMLPPPNGPPPRLVRYLDAVWSPDAGVAPVAPGDVPVGAAPIPAPEAMVGEAVAGRDADASNADSSSPGGLPMGPTEHTENPRRLNFAPGTPFAAAGERGGPPADDLDPRLRDVAVAAAAVTAERVLEGLGLTSSRRRAMPEAAVLPHSALEGQFRQLVAQYPLDGLTTGWEADRLEGTEEQTRRLPDAPTFEEWKNIVGSVQAIDYDPERKVYAENDVSKPSAAWLEIDRDVAEATLLVADPAMWMLKPDEQAKCERIAAGSGAAADYAKKRQALSKALRDEQKRLLQIYGTPSSDAAASKPVTISKYRWNSIHDAHEKALLYAAGVHIEGDKTLSSRLADRSWHGNNSERPAEAYRSAAFAADHSFEWRQGLINQIEAARREEAGSS